MTESKICVECGKEYFRKPEEETRYWIHRKFCSKECSHHVKVHTSKVCPTCGKEFMPKRNQRYCSEECRAKRLHHPRVKVKKICVVCGAEYMGFDYVTKTGNQQLYCSDICMHKARQQRKIAFDARFGR